ncbi:glycogen debranching protein GlgX [Sphingomonas sp. KR1UV-12]|uniref:Glycogen debranching protein GlgX n=1 Tax=Sphingomonas aurea TaxID=3063994 RepID=A0ABT9EMX9_9SPHN|nr:glycogen debranching protein GlgX [Sphingomonas sp. KR1UV-12]MDP1028315.1 glycogen debranching protein GlgX [Sphingomonas sp. KR1UV-12]
MGAHPSEGATSFAVRAPEASAVWLCLFDGIAERRVAMARSGDLWITQVAGVGPGQRYGYRAEGPVARGFDPAKLLVDPYAVELDGPFAYDPRLGVRGEDTAALMPKAVVPVPWTDDPVPPRLFQPGQLIYELNVRGFTMRHPDVPAEQRGTIAALAHPAVIAHLQKLGVAAVELMPIAAWIDERHLHAAGLRNAWGYNPVTMMALDPRLAPGGTEELRATLATLRSAGIGVILDVVFNHTGESDEGGPTLCFRGLDPASYARGGDGRLINDAGTGNMLDFAQAHVRDLALDTLRHFARLGVEGFRFDLAPVMARGPGFDAAAPIFAAIAADPILSTRQMIAEPWDIGPGGYQLGHFPPDWLEWNDRFRDDVRRFWRGDGAAGTLATRLAGSSDVFAASISVTRSVNFIAAHDGFALADVVAYAGRHNLANGENNRDGHADEVCWNNGVEGPSDDAEVRRRRDGDVRALLAILFAARGTPMLTAGDEFGRSQGGNNNAYAQDNETSWLDWQGRDTALEDFVARLSRFRRAGALADQHWLEAADWRDMTDRPMTAERWAGMGGFLLRLPDGERMVYIRIDRGERRVTLALADMLESRP